MAGLGDSNELELALADRRLNERARSLALLAFSPDELEFLPAEQRNVLYVLLKRRLRQQATEPDVGDCLRIRQQFEQFCENRFSDPAAKRLAAQLR